MTDDRFQKKPPPKPERFPPRRKWPKLEEGQDFFTLTEKYGRPFGPFDRERQLVYVAGNP
jgi:hypothetical protein